MNGCGTSLLHHGCYTWINNVWTLRQHINVLYPTNPYMCFTWKTSQNMSFSPPLLRWRENLRYPNIYLDLRSITSLQLESLPFLLRTTRCVNRCRLAWLCRRNDLRYMSWPNKDFNNLSNEAAYRFSWDRVNDLPIVSKPLGITKEIYTSRHALSTVINKGKHACSGAAGVINTQRQHHVIC